MSNYMFENRTISSMTWWVLQEAACAERLDCTKVCDVERAGPVFELRNPTTKEVCYVFGDEAQQFSNPYRTMGEAEEMSRKYADTL